MADAKGYVRMPNVDVVSEMVNTMSASRSYQANVEVLNTTQVIDVENPDSGSIKE